MDRVEFFRNQAERFAALAQGCTDPNVREQLIKMAHEYREMIELLGAQVEPVPSSPKQEQS
jgi:hypothetical protein